MKTIVNLLLLVSMAGTIQAQVRVGVTGGLGITSLSVKENGQKPEGLSHPAGLGFLLGGFGEYPLPQHENLSVRAGLELAFSSFREKYSDPSGMGYKFSTSFTSLLVPVQARYDFTVGGHELFVMGGPYLRANLGGKTNDSGNAQKLEFGKEGDYRAMTTGLRLGVGYRFYLPSRQTSLQASLNGPAESKREIPVDFELMGQLMDGNLASDYYAKQYKNKARMYAVMVAFHWTFPFYKNR